MAAIYDSAHFELITDGLQGCVTCDEAIKTAERIADRFGRDVILSDDDGDWLVHPIGMFQDGKREPADPYEWEQ